MPAKTPVQRRRDARNGFDKLARPYRWLEYLSFGPLLWRTRTGFLGEMGSARRGLMLGDGDGRFTAALLRANHAVQLHAVDASGAMLERLLVRAEKQGDASRVCLLHADATAHLPDGCFDLVCSHFFLDCLSDAQSRGLACLVAERMQPSACWIVSEFAVPPGRARWPGRILVRGLYAAFGMLTGLGVRHLPEYAEALCAAGLECVAVQTRLGGILRAEMWLLRQRAAHATERRDIQPGMRALTGRDDLRGSIDDGIGSANYPPLPDDEILPGIPSDPVPNPEPEQPSLGMPDPGVYEGTGGTASLESE